MQAALGQARVLQMQHQLADACDLLTELSVRSPWFTPGLVERCQVLLALGDWEALVEACQQIRKAEPSNSVALTFQGEWLAIGKDYTAAFRDRAHHIVARLVY